MTEQNLSQSSAWYTDAAELGTVPEDQRFKAGDTVWLPGEHPVRATVEADQGHPHWLTLHAPTGEGRMTLQWTRSNLGRSERDAVKMWLKHVAQYIQSWINKYNQLAEQHGLPLI